MLASCRYAMCSDRTSTIHTETNMKLSHMHGRLRIRWRVIGETRWEVLVEKTVRGSGRRRVLVHAESDTWQSYSTVTSAQSSRCFITALAICFLLSNTEITRDGANTVQSTKHQQNVLHHLQDSCCFSPNPAPARRSSLCCAGVFRRLRRASIL